MLAPILGILSLIGIVVWTALVTVAGNFSGLGDGAASGLSKSELVFGYSGSVYLLLVFLSCFPFMRGKFLVTTGIFAHLIFGVFAFSLIAKGGFGAAAILIPFMGFAAGWFALYKKETRMKGS